MKRSEIINLITDIVGDKANEVLQKLEEAGMQPPAIKEPCESFVLANGQYLKVADSFVFTNKWDEE